MKPFCDWLRKKLEQLKQSWSFPCGSGEMTKKERERLFMENGSKLLEEMLISCKEKCRCNPIRSFSADQILDATQSFRSAFFNDGWIKWYNGVLDGNPVLIKKHERDEINYDGAFRDIAISSQMSSQKNVLKLLGCCLEFVAPVLVFESAENGPLRISGDKDFNGVVLSWETRLRIARDVARAITYLHTAFHCPILHRDIKPGNIFLDENYVPKLSGFELCIAIPEGETQVEGDSVVGSIGFLDPVSISLEARYYSEYSDVYSFGVFLLILLTGQNALVQNPDETFKHISEYVADLLVNGRFDEIVDRKIWEADGGINEEKKQQFLAFTNIALSCTQSEDRPLMIDVAKELAKIERSPNVAPTTSMFLTSPVMCFLLRLV